MPVSERTRKILWGRSGNRCAVCRRELAVNATAADDELIVGAECHIISDKPSGPRHDPGFPRERLHRSENLILLCAVDHKMVDDQSEICTAERLREIKASHEKWVRTVLTEPKRLPPVRLRRVKENVPTHLARITSGQELINVVADAMGYSFDHDELCSEADVEFVSSFLQQAQDWGESWSDLEAGGRVRAAYSMNTLLRELEQAGFWVFGGREVLRLEGGADAPRPFPIAVLRVVRATNPEIICEDNP